MVQQVEDPVLEGLGAPGGSVQASYEVGYLSLQAVSLEAGTAFLQVGLDVIPLGPTEAFAVEIEVDLLEDLPTSLLHGRTTRAGP